MNKQSLKRAGLFIFLVAGVYTCYITSSLVHERIYKEPFTNELNQQKQYFDGKFIFTMFPGLIAAIIGKSILSYRQCINKENFVQIPNKKIVVCGLIIVISNYTYNQAILSASYPAIVMIKSCGLLSVIAVGVFCSGVKEKRLKLSKKKLLIGIIATCGILLFNYSKTVEKVNDVNHPIRILSYGTFCLLVSIILDGFLPDFQAQIKSEYKPSPIEMYFTINWMTCRIAFISSIIIYPQIVKTFQFIINCKEFFLCILSFSLLNGIGQLFIYKIVTEFKQHIPAFVVATRKCMTVVVNLLFFGHKVDMIQQCGIIIVFLAVMFEVYDNVSQKKKQSYDAIQNLDKIEKQIDDKISQSQQQTISVNEQQQQTH